MKRLLILLLFVILITPAVVYAGDDIPVFDGRFIVEQNDNYPAFCVRDLTTQVFESYSDLDKLGRAGAAMACIGRESFLKETWASMEGVFPSGWNASSESNTFERCHLIAKQLTGADTVNNLITGTHYLNVEGMLPYENWVSMYVKNTGNHVLYRVTPWYKGDQPVASAVQMEGYSVEDLGAGICFNVLLYNIQPGTGINYATGETWPDGSMDITITETFEETEVESIEALGSQ